MNQDFYQILGIKPNASDTEIRSAYKALAKKYHPDKNVGNIESEEIFKNINAAYQTLSDPWKRMSYDFKREHLNNPSPPMSPPPLKTKRKVKLEDKNLKAYLLTALFFAVITTAGIYFYQYMNRISAERTFEEAKILAKHKQDDEAYEKFTEAITFDENFALAYLHRGLLCAKYPNKKNAAIANFVQAYIKDTTLKEAFFYLGKTYLDLEQVSKAKDYFESYYKYEPKNDSLLFYMARLAYVHEKDYTKALYFYTELSKLDKKSAEAFAGQGECYFQQKQFKKSIYAFNEAIRLQPKNSDWIYTRGLAKIKLNLPLSACKDLAKSGSLGNRAAMSVWKKYCK